jgi:hypothetical protein
VHYNFKQEALSIAKRMKQDQKFSNRHRKGIASSHPFFSRIDFGMALTVVLGVLCVQTAYIFFITAGTWGDWIATTAYYDKLAESFAAGRLWIEEKPDPALLALPNPYDPKARSGIPYPQDVSLYNGRFYLYFGPVPALILVFIKPFIGGSIRDQYLVFGFMTGIFVLQASLISSVWRRFFFDIPSWLLLPGILVSGLISPFGWTLNLASVYNAAILSGQFFFLAGLCSAFSALKKPQISKGKLFLAGFFWFCAIGSRMTQVIPVGFMVMMILIWFLRERRGAPLHFNPSAAIVFLGIPLLAGALWLGWYNWARFDSVFESGITYQLAGVDLQKYQQELFSYRYIANNFFNYFLIKPSVDKKFPFLGPVKGVDESIIKFVDIPDIYFSQETAGLLYIAPFILFSLVPIISTFKNFRKGTNSTEQKDASRFNWVVISLFGSFFTSLLFFLSFFWAGVRYLADFMPALVMLSVFGFWQSYRYAGKSLLLRFAVATLGLALIGITIVNSNLIALSISSAKYREFNPELWRQLIKFFNNLP